MVTAESTGFAIHCIDASTEGGHPKIAFVIFPNGRHIIVAEAVFLMVDVLEPGKAVESGVVTIQTIEGAHPKLMLVVFVNTGNVAVAEAIGVFCGVFVHGHLVPVVTIQAIAGAQPQEATMILVNGFDGTVGEAIFVLDVFEVEFGLLRLGVCPG